MFYVIYSEDHDNSLSKRLSVREHHISRLKDLQKSGRLLVAGPCPAIDCEDPGEAGFTGSLVSAQAWADEDPYISAGVYKKVTVKPYKKVLPS